MPPRRPPPKRPKRRRPTLRKPELTVSQILSWMDEFHSIKGRWPNDRSGRLVLRDESWAAINQALRAGVRGLPGGSSLAKVLAMHRDYRNIGDLPKLKEAEIVLWAKVHFQRTGHWPSLDSGDVIGNHGETWGAIDRALNKGRRGFPGGSSLAKLLAAHDLKRHYFQPPALTIQQILDWADKFHACHGKWPTRKSGAIDGSPQDVWFGIDMSLRDGKRGLPKGSSLAELLMTHRGSRNPHCLPKMSEDEIVRWAKAYFRRTGKWPTVDSGRIDQAPGETWNAINAALVRGARGLPGESTLALLLATLGLKRHLHQPPAFTIQQILNWVDEFHLRHGAWPKARSGAIISCFGETWRVVDTALSLGLRGLPGGSSLTEFLNEHRGIFNGTSRCPRLTPRSKWLRVEEILHWGKAYRQRWGVWPNRTSGPVQERPELNWSALDKALSSGYRQLPGGSSLSKLFRDER